MVIFYFLIFLNLKEHLITVNEHLMTGEFMVGPNEKGCFLFSFR